MKTWFHFWGGHCLWERLSLVCWFKTITNVLTLGGPKDSELRKNNSCFREDVRYCIEVASSPGSLGKLKPQNIGWFPPRKWIDSLSMILREKEIKDLWEKKKSSLLWRQGVTDGLNSRKERNAHGKSQERKLSWDDGKPVRGRKTNLPPVGKWGASSPRGNLGTCSTGDNHLILSAVSMSPAFTMPWQYWLFITKK